MKERFTRLDLAGLRFLRTRGHSPGLERAAMLLSKSGENAYLWFVIGAIGVIADPGRRWQWVVIALLGPAAIVANFAIKLVVGRARPQLDGLPPLGGAPSSLSFPSAHAASSFAVAVAITRILPGLGIPLLAVAAVMALSRPYLGMHYPSDIVAGALLGVAIGLFVPLPAGA